MVNEVFLIGRLGRDPEVRHTQGGVAVASLSVATSRRQKNRNTQEWEETTEWNNVVAFGKTAEFCGNHIVKGSLVYINGRLQTRKWQDREGNDRWTTEVVVQELRPLERGSGRQGNEDKADTPAAVPYDDVPF